MKKAGCDRLNMNKVKRSASSMTDNVNFFYIRKIAIIIIYTFPVSSKVHNVRFLFSYALTAIARYIFDRSQRVHHIG